MTDQMRIGSKPKDLKYKSIRIILDKTEDKWLQDQVKKQRRSVGAIIGILVQEALVRELQPEPPYRELLKKIANTKFKIDGDLALEIAQALAQGL